jgi:hypothetical protein
LSYFGVQVALAFYLIHLVLLCYKQNEMM